MRRKVTMQQIADMAGVSKFAVSRALSGKTGVSEQTRAYIVKVAGELGFFEKSKRAAVRPGYHPGDTENSGTVLVLFPNIRYQNVENKYWGFIYDGISQKLQDNGLDMITLTQPFRDNVTQLFNPKMILGVICVGTVSTQVLLELQSMQLPMVIIDHIDPAIQCDGVFVDNYFMMRKLMAILISKGYQRFQFVGKTSYAFSFEERWRAFQDSLSEYGIAHNQLPQLMTSDNLNEYEGVMSIPQEELPQIFVCANDCVALSVYDALNERGIKIPAECGVTGFDNTEYVQQLIPKLTSVHVPKEAMGARAVERLMQRIANRDDCYEKTLLLGDVVLQHSTI
ncbi:LacI family DNA-binding transcriptional regulator [Paenibacillus fonticola]|uniref:LacI family DNA-binding transcriptional regulator n=1 Tax=Paenibacillus fonticola TaxID=379896 RepID=UPI0004769AB6|nr:LacI family DNA-binding transcriptional regulator [Paenibacillus fonticola]